MKDADDYVRATLVQALSMADGHPLPEVRGTAAKTVRVLVRALCPDRIDERFATDVANVMGRHVHEPQVTLHLLRALVHGCATHDKLAGGIEWLAEQAARCGLRTSLWHLVCTMLETPPWGIRVRPEWANDALAHTMASHNPEQGGPEKIMCSWLDLHGAVPGWMAAAVHQRPELLASPRLPHRHVWALHISAPSATGWRLLASHPKHRSQPLGPSAFGGELDAAIDSLDRALGEEGDSTRRLVLARWLAEMGGEA